VKLSDIQYENKTHWVKKTPKGFEVYRIGVTHSTRCAIIGYKGDKGLSWAIAEANKRDLATII